MDYLAIVVIADSIPLGWFDPVVQGSDNYLRVQAHPRTPRPVNDPKEWARNHTGHGISVWVSGAKHVDFIRQELGIDVLVLESDPLCPLDKSQHVLMYSPKSKAWWTL